MANFKFFADLNGETIPLHGNILGIKNAEFAAKYPGLKGRRFDSFEMQAMYGPDNQLYPVTRVIEFKSNPSRHECDARCLHAKGRIMKCECSCGGKNHGKYA